MLWSFVLTCLEKLPTSTTNSVPSTLSFRLPERTFKPLNELYCSFGIAEAPEEKMLRVVAPNFDIADFWLSFRGMYTFLQKAGFYDKVMPGLLRKAVLEHQVLFKYMNYRNLTYNDSLKSDILYFNSAGENFSANSNTVSHALVRVVQRPNTGRKKLKIKVMHQQRSCLNCL